jgi:hypothetical protein
VREDRFGASTKPSKSSFFLGGDQHIDLEGGSNAGTLR